MAVVVGELQRCVHLGRISGVNSGSRVSCNAENAPRQRVRCQPSHWDADSARNGQGGGYPRVELRRQWRSFSGGLDGYAQLQQLGLGCSKVFVVRAGPDATAEETAPADAVEPKEPKPAPRYPGEKKGFVEEMRFVAMKLHTKDQSKEGERDAQTPVAKWKPTVDGYIQFLVDSKEVYDTMERIVEEAADPSYAVFRNTGLERSAALAKDLDWFKSEGHNIPSPGTAGREYAEYLLKLAKEDPPGFICHYYNVYFAHTAGGRFIGKKVSDDVLDGRTLEFYKWDGDVKEILASVKEKLNKVAEEWSRESKNHCLEETELSFSYSGKLLRLIASAPQ